MKFNPLHIIFEHLRCKLNQITICIMYSYERYRGVKYLTCCLSLMRKSRTIELRPEKVICALDLTSKYCESTIRTVIDYRILSITFRLPHFRNRQNRSEIRSIHAKSPGIIMALVILTDLSVSEFTHVRLLQLSLQIFK
jgi:hypothetical protein